MRRVQRGAPGSSRRERGLPCRRDASSGRPRLLLVDYLRHVARRAPPSLDVGGELDAPAEQPMRSSQRFGGRPPVQAVYSPPRLGVGRICEMGCWLYPWRLSTCRGSSDVGASSNSRGRAARPRAHRAISAKMASELVRRWRLARPAFELDPDSASEGVVLQRLCLRLEGKIHIAQRINGRCAQSCVGMLHPAWRRRLRRWPRTGSAPRVFLSNNRRGTSEIPRECRRLGRGQIPGARGAPRALLALLRAA